MSQSPSTSIDPNSILKYRQGWRALNRLLHEDKSFSGHEKNCAFLNMGNGQFAAVSSVTGLDFDDDSRAIATCDWDFDGKLDFWMTARTAPRLRLVRNQETQTGDFISLKLEGKQDGTNRDAIGARVEVVLANGDKANRLIKTVHAGDAFLSQSSNWLHFGLGASAQIDSITVRWPTNDSRSRSQQLTGVTPNRFYVVRQGDVAPEAWIPPTSRKKLQPSTPPSVPSTGPIRIVLPSRLPLPRIETLSATNGQSSVLSLSGPTLVNVWSATCPNCVRELSAWAANAQEFQQRGLAIMAVNADAGNENANAETVIEQLEASLPWAEATEASIQAIDFFQRAMLDRWQPLPVPTSFLLDKDGQVVVIYKGEVSAEQLWKDLELVDFKPEQLRQAAAPFEGQWLRSVPTGEPTAVSKQMIDHRAVNMAISYLGQFIESNQGASASRLADTYYVRGLLLESQKRFQDAIESFRQSAKLKPEDVRSHSDLARLLDQFGKLTEAQNEWMTAYKINKDNYDVQHGLATNLLRQKKFKASSQLLKRMIASRPNDAVAHFRLATAYRHLKSWHEAKASYSRVMELKPDMILAANNLAWMLATHPDSSIRDGNQAVALAKRACAATKFRQPQLLDTLSVAYAERGDFDEAITTAQKAIAIMESRRQDHSDAIKPLQDRVKAFEAKQPYRESQ